MSRRKNVRFLHEILDRREMLALLGASDAYVSLHRSEGFGFPLCEAMALGKPVIATAYSANMDYMHPENSLPVRYRLVTIAEDHGPYQRGNVWAEPDIDHAAEQMRRLALDPDLARQLGARARQDIRDGLNPVRIGALIRTRLAELLAKGPPAHREAKSAAFMHQLIGLRALADAARAGVEAPAVARLGWPGRLLGRGVVAARKAAMRLLRPFLARQVEYNAAVEQLLAQLSTRLECQERELAELRRRIGESV